MAENDMLQELLYLILIINELLSFRQRVSNLKAIKAPSKAKITLK